MHIDGDFLKCTYFDVVKFYFYLHFLLNTQKN